MLIRRAWRFAHGMGVETPFLSGVANALVAKMGEIYPELRQFQKAIRYQITTEEERFMRMLDNSLQVMEGIIERVEAEGRRTMSGEEAFFLHSTHGLPLEITRDLLKERKLGVDEASFREARQRHEEVSEGEIESFADISVYRDILDSLQTAGQLGKEGVVYNPYDYDKLSQPTSVLAILKDRQRVTAADIGDQLEIVLANTAFYVESGGQVSDTGAITGNNCSVRVDDVRRPVGGLIIHQGTVTRGRLSAGDSARADVDLTRRWDIMRNHTATHLLHAALRQVLGEHVRQKGSHVAPDRLRFDFSHNARLSEDEKERITAEVNRLILSNIPVRITIRGLDEARREGAMALFGEKYGATVRTVTVCAPEDSRDDCERFSYELCGGTHVRTTAEIGPFLILEEGSSGSGVRRIEAVTGRVAQQVTDQRLAMLRGVAGQLGAARR
jgi:alanyl-tRNA synthetase